MTVQELNGWAPASVTVDADGNVLSVTVQEPRFTPNEKALLLAARRERLVPRGEHGFPLTEAMDPKNQFAFTAEGPVQDWAQKVLDDAKAAYRKAYPKAEMGSLRWRVERAD